MSTAGRCSPRRSSDGTDGRSDFSHQLLVGGATRINFTAAGGTSKGDVVGYGAESEQVVFIAGRAKHSTFEHPASVDAHPTPR
jgi:hypothetical protein